jgi:alkylhydroperoxidase/carboxymuconolactone decarboxylase family protein YurZ
MLARDTGEDPRQVLAHDLGLDVDDPSLRYIEDTYALRYAALSRAAHRRNALRPADRELLWVAIFASAHLYDAAAVRLHTSRALAAGATARQLLGLRVETLGTHTMSFAVPILLEELAAAGQHAPTLDKQLTESETELKQQLVDLRGWWNEGWLPLLRLDPEFLLATHELLAAEKDILDPRLRELIYMALDVSTAHLYPPGARAHIRNALTLGASAEEILEVFELVALVSYRSLLLLTESLDAAAVSEA